MLAGTRRRLNRRRQAFWISLLAVLLLCPAHVFAGNPTPWTPIPAGRAAKLERQGSGPVGFSAVPASNSGIHFTNSISREHTITNQIDLNGSGVALGDVDADGWCDVFLCAIERPSALFRNLGGWRFEEATRGAGLDGFHHRTTGAVFADLDGDADLDLILNTVGGGTHLFLNDGRGHFAPAPNSPINPGKGGMSLALADVDSDGDLDLYLVNYRTDTIRDHPDMRLQGERVNGRMTVSKVDGRPTTEPDLVGRFELKEDGQILENGEPDVLLLNDGRGGFTPVSFTGGAFLTADGQPLQKPPYDWGLSVAFRDLNGDRLPDLYVCNDFESPDRIWLNRGKGSFQAAPPTALRHTSIFSMGIDVGDLNRDGYDDLFISDMLMQGHTSRHIRIGEVPPIPHLPGSATDRPQYSFNTVQINRGDGTYAETAWFSGAEASGWTWCPVLLDVDLDGFEDVLFTTGHEFDMMNGDVIERAEAVKQQKKMSPSELRALRTMFDRFNTPKVAFRNAGGLRFEDCSTAWGFADAAVSQGIALADLDNDGDLDIVINNLNDAAGVYRNNAPGPVVAVRLKGRAPNTSGVGARITLHGGAVAAQSQEMVTGAHYLSSDAMERVFAAGSDTQAMRLEVLWRSGGRSVIDDIRANHRYELEEPSGMGAPSVEPIAVAPWFKEVAGFGPVHKEPFFDDAERQPLLPFRLSQLGPGVAWMDYDDDGWEDLVVGSARGGTPSFFRNNGKGGLEPAPDAVRSKPVARDQAGIVGSAGLFIMGASNYEDGTTNGGWVRLYDTRRGIAGDSLLGPTASAGPLAMVDADGDDDLDLFVGGRAVGGHYPRPAQSTLYRNDGGRLTPAVTWEQMGLASGAVFSDLNLDGRPDLVVACEWGPLRVFWNEGNFKFKESTRELGLEPWTGWWHGVTAGDFDGDGRMDLAASNWGRNSRFQPTAERPLKCYYGDLDGDGTVDILEAQPEPQSGEDVPLRGFRAVASTLPWFRDSTGSYEAYAKGTLKSLFGDRLSACSVVQIRTVASMIFLNRGDHFEPVELPPEAQWTAAFGLGVGDFNGDGNEDLFLSQNFFAVPPDGVRQDAGRGLWLQGNGHGAFEPVRSQESGVVLYGEQRGCALSDFDGDGRVDLVVAQNGEATKLFQNLRARPGVRVRLIGGVGNPTAMGASLRARAANGWGPRRELHAGSGYWSQDGAVQVLHASQPIQEIEVRWPGGRQTRHPVASGATELTLQAARTSSAK
jgi:hypothetical protein